MNKNCFCGGSILQSVSTSTDVMLPSCKNFHASEQGLLNSSCLILDTSSTSNHDSSPSEINHFLTKAFSSYIYVQELQAAGVWFYSVVARQIH